MLENWRQSEIFIVTNNKSQDSAPKHLSCDGLLHHKFVTHFPGKRIFKINEHLALQAKWLIMSYAPFALDFFPNVDILKGTGSVATYFKCGGIFKYEFVENLPLSLPAKEFWKSVNIWESYGQEFSFFGSRCREDLLLSSVAVGLLLEWA